MLHWIPQAQFAGFFIAYEKGFYKKHGIDLTIVPGGLNRSSYEYLRDGVQVASAMYYNEYHNLLNSGLDSHELTPFFFRDYGLDFPEDGIYTLEDTLKSDPELCRSFVKASQEGWRHVFANPDDAVLIVLKYLRKAHIPASWTHQKWVLKHMRELIFKETESDSLWKLTKEGFIRTVDEMKRIGFIEYVPDYKEFYKDLSR